ncbi:hypothetical protein EIN_000350 [Entamoeba invadens IP1]|uniref:Uncharacterized protein n=1 Tax=Entamoeba invadens IP1 TaxID=370355 RepID=L7FJ37_ENTIV|nr:hypothetical protein EIN_000350 [Entamoeba invadens IP1]ELP83602.1 hypothetical protein EIN_000350 [Entamoeba invadens IP1]|eukprot:XP_004182948.1 hypothetical protein EIN_000350 [Entamoeba invadens IP1]
MWQEHTEFFIEHIQKDYPLFLDLTIPVLFGLYLLKTGLRIGLYKKIILYLRNEKTELLLKCIITFPVNSNMIQEQAKCIGDFIQHIEENKNVQNSELIKICNKAGAMKEEQVTYKYTTKTNQLAVDEDEYKEEYRAEFSDFFVDVQDLLKTQSLSM